MDIFSEVALLCQFHPEAGEYPASGGIVARSFIFYDLPLMFQMGFTRNFTSTVGLMSSSICTIGL
jgi:hypothetical protein